jgi:hypothetical protein
MFDLSYSSAESARAIPWRYEKKFTAASQLHADIGSMLKLHPARFAASFPPRFVNNLYFDTIGLRCYRDSADGIGRRFKVRMRWYGDLFGEILEPRLEIKLKIGELGHKIGYPLKRFNFEKEIEGESVTRFLTGSELPAELVSALHAMRPVLVNRYYRDYHRSADGNLNVTLDAGMKFLAIHLGKNEFVRIQDGGERVILEAKYGREMNFLASRLWGDIPFRRMKYSKYMAGMSLLYPDQGAAEPVP